MVIFPILLLTLGASHLVLAAVIPLGDFWQLEKG